jgi:hypothetical protein
MRRDVLLAALGLALFVTGGLRSEPSASGAAPAQLQSPGPQLAALLGFVDERLVSVDPATLQALPGTGIAVGSGGCSQSQGGTACRTNPSWAVAPDGAQLAIARNDVSSLRLVDVGRMRVSADLRWGFDGGLIGGLAWLAPRRVLAIQEVSSERQRLIAFDLAEKRIVVRRTLGGRVLQLRRTAREVVLLLAPPRSIGPARVAVVDRRGAVRFARVGRILVGSKLLGTGSNHRVDARSPGFAIDSQGRRAFVVAQDLAAEVDLRTPAVSYHSLDRSPSLLSRLWSWLEPVAHAKQVSGYHREARWLGADLIAVSGSDTEQGRYRPAGLLLVDTRTWNVRTIDRGATGFRVTADALLATGGWWDKATKRTIGIGVAAYGFDGGKRFELLGGEHAWIAEVYGGRAYVGVAGGAEPLRIVDLTSGQIVGLRQEPLPWLLLGAGSGWWD